MGIRCQGIYYQETFEKTFDHVPVADKVDYLYSQNRESFQKLGAGIFLGVMAVSVSLQQNSLT